LFEITIADAKDVFALADYEMVVIADDSGSMNNAAEPDHVRKGEAKKTRWHELCETVKNIVEIASCFDESGIDVYFLNREPAPRVKSAKDEHFLRAIEKKPKGTTPLTEALEKVAANAIEDERKTILFILTDGEPDGGQEKFSPVVRSVIASGKVHIQIMACTAEEAEIGWLNQLDAGNGKVDVCDDYHSEKREVITAGMRKRFTRGDWCIKAMIGPISHKFDKWDELLGKRGFVSPECCTACSLM